jgi:MoxR-like ATPase
VLAGADLGAARKLIDTIRLDEKILIYILDLVRATREDPEIREGGSTRAADALAAAVRASAALDGRDYAIPDDVQALFTPAMRHRVILGPSAEIEGRTPDDVLSMIVARIEAPR